MSVVMSVAELERQLGDVAYAAVEGGLSDADYVAQVRQLERLWVEGLREQGVGDVSVAVHEQIAGVAWGYLEIARLVRAGVNG